MGVESECFELPSAGAFNASLIGVSFEKFLPGSKFSYGSGKQVFSAV
jgi:hypothetical protein